MRFLTLFLTLISVAVAQPARTPNDTLVSPEVHADGRVTFRLYAPKASAVVLRGEWLPANTSPALTRNEEGVWSVTTDPIPPDLYWYHFAVDGVKTLDPRNALLKTGARSADSAVDVPGPAAEFQALRDVPHGTVHVEWYRGAAGKIRRLHVYTPRGMMPRATSIPSSICSTAAATATANGPATAAPTSSPTTLSPPAGSSRSLS